MKWLVVVIAIAVFSLPFVYVFQKKKITNQATQISSMKLTSPVFQENGNIPVKYTCKGENINPALYISEVPTNTESLALVLEDPDAPAGTWYHWLLWNIPPSTTTISENSTPPQAVLGTTSFGNKKYGGPCPPVGSHRYIFKLFALDTTLTLPSEATNMDLVQTMQGHIVGQTSLMGIFP